MTLAAIYAACKAAWKARRNLAKADVATDAHRDKLKARIIAREKGETK